jgi:hypothetical protein
MITDHVFFLRYELNLCISLNKVFLQRVKTSHILSFTNCNVFAFIKISVISGVSCDGLRRAAVIKLVLNVRPATLTKHKFILYILRTVAEHAVSEL